MSQELFVRFCEQKIKAKSQLSHVGYILSVKELRNRTSRMQQAPRQLIPDNPSQTTHPGITHPRQLIPDNSSPRQPIPGHLIPSPLIPRTCDEYELSTSVYVPAILPLVYCLLPDKMELTYKRALQLLFDFNPAEIRRPKNIMIDFEKAEVNVIREMLPNTQVHGCYFHFSQSVWRNIKSSGLAIRYANDVQYNVHLRKFSALAFCKEQDVLVRYSQLATQLLRDYGVSDAHENFLEYFENTWVGRTTRRPRYEISMWNCKSVTELELPRTNNSVESWHNAFQGAMGSEHPNVYKLVDKLLDEQVRVKAICAKLAAGEDSPLYSRKEYEIKNRKLLSIIEAHDQMPADEYLESCGNYVVF
ncbi:hypothetical protein QR680_015965 [Steinernema hermaphroditum]|uniref:MULE transposase domain-containing protein n=1 Tax=Steinernema hermaphroditum TaxID=289476 RepID=A0AA39LLN2_9BILA|nr:hypothetical protein QR680_015965 [Steinernema hermaphroditum]